MLFYDFYGSNAHSTKNYRAMQALADRFDINSFQVEETGNDNAGFDRGQG